MAKHRLINCEFVNASSFKANMSNRAKLLYLTMLTNADDKGFVDTTQELINSLANNDIEFDKKISLELLSNTYESALNELLDKGYIYEFKDNHNNVVHLIRHWFYHNNYKKGLWTNYRAFFDKVHLDSGEYIIGKKPLKETNLNETNINENNINELLEKEPNKEKNETNDDELTEDDLPFVVSQDFFKKGNN